MSNSSRESDCVHPRWRPLTGWLASVPAPLLALYAIGASFSTYFSMYAFRKPFAAASFAGEQLGLLDLKTALVISQIVGYTLSKYLGIKVCSETSAQRRAATLVLLVVASELALVLFAVVPNEWKVVAIFLNGLPLGMVWGMVVGYLEGRRTSELMLAGLSCSFILASGVVKDVGRALLSSGISESWMPAATGLAFLPGFLVAVWLLDQVPQPTVADVAARVQREPMDRGDRRAFVRRFLLGLALLLPVYLFLTAYRDFRDNYGIEIFGELGFADQPAIFTRTEVPVALGVMLALAALNLIRDNRAGLLGAYAIMTVGTLLVGGGTLLLDAGRIDGATWMIVVGLGSYLAYVPYGSVLFDRLIASTGAVGTAVFAIYLADAIGYTGSVGMQLYKDLGQAEMSRLGFFRNFSYFMSLFGAVLLTGSCLYFMRYARRSPADVGCQPIGTPLGGADGSDVPLSLGSTGPREGELASQEPV